MELLTLSPQKTTQLKAVFKFSLLQTFINIQVHNYSMANKEVYVNKSFNTEITTNSIFVLDVQDSADLHNYLPLNKLRLANLSAETIWVYLDELPNVSSKAPDYVIGAGLGVDEGFLEGVQFNTVYIVNKGTGTIAANEITLRVSKVEEVS